MAAANADAGDSPVYVILGASGGIGSNVCKRLAEQGAQLVMGARTEEPLKRLASELGGDAYPLDATQYDDVQAIVTHATDTYGRLDGLVNCVGSILIKPAHLTSVEEFETTIALNLHSAFYAVKASARAMMKKGGSIVLSASAVAQTGLTNHEAISAAKAGVIGLTKAAAATYANRGIRVNAVAPGLVQTPLTQRITANEAGRKQSEAMHALGRLGEPSDVASAIEWLLSAKQSWVTGQVLAVDGGLGSLRPR